MVRLTLDEYQELVRDVTLETYEWIKPGDVMHPEDLMCHMVTVAQSIALALGHQVVRRAAERAVPKDRPSAPTDVDHERTAH